MSDQEVSDDVETDPEAVLSTAPFDYVERTTRLMRKSRREPISPGSLSPPHFIDLCRALYGMAGTRRMSLVYGCREATLYQMSSGDRGIPRALLQSMYRSATDDHIGREIARRHRIKSEQDLADRLAAREYVARWVRLYLDGLVSVPRSRIVQGRYRWAPHEATRHLKKRVRD
jgi:hypothetical protein